MPDTWTIDPGPAQVAIATDPTAGQLTLTKVTAPPPEPKVTFAASEEGGDATVREYNNREVTLTVFLAEGTQAAVDSQQTALLERIAKLQREGGILEWKHAALGPVQFDVVTASTAAGEHDLTYVLANALPIELKFTCRPFARGTERLLGQGTKVAAQRFLALSGLQVPGDAPALARVALSGASADQRTVMFGMDQPDPSDTTTVSEFACSSMSRPSSASLVTSAGSVSAQVVRRAAFSAAPGAWEPGVYLRDASGPLGVSGDYRVFLRVQSPGGGQVRLRWRAGDRQAGLTMNTAASVPDGGFALVDLGSVSAGPGERLDGVVERMLPGGAVDYDRLILMPTTRSGRLYASTANAPSEVVAGDQFAASGLTTLTGSTAPAGGVWSTVAGGGTDWQSAGGGRVTRGYQGTGRSVGLTIPSAVAVVSASLRIDIIGTPPSTLPTNAVAIGNTAGIAALTTGTGATGAWAVAAGLTSYPVPPVAYYRYWIVSGTSIVTGDMGHQGFAGVTRPVAVMVRYDGSTVTMTVNINYSFTATVAAAPATGIYAALVTSGLANADAGEFLALGSNGDPADAALYGGQTAEVTSTRSVRTSAAGLTGPIAVHDGDRPALLPSGRAGRTARVVIGTSRTDLRGAADWSAGDTFTAAVYATPRYLQLPDANA